MNSSFQNSQAPVATFSRAVPAPPRAPSALGGQTDGAPPRSPGAVGPLDVPLTCARQPQPPIALRRSRVRCRRAARRGCLPAGGLADLDARTALAPGGGSGDLEPAPRRRRVTRPASSRCASGPVSPSGCRSSNCAVSLDSGPPGRADPGSAAHRQARIVAASGARGCRRGCRVTQPPVSRLRAGLWPARVLIGCRSALHRRACARHGGSGALREPPQGRRQPAKKSDALEGNGNASPTGPPRSAQGPPAPTPATLRSVPDRGAERWDPLPRACRAGFPDSEIENRRLRDPLASPGSQSEFGNGEDSRQAGELLTRMIPAPPVSQRSVCREILQGSPRSMLGLFISLCLRLASASQKCDSAASGGSPKRSPAITSAGVIALRGLRGCLAPAVRRRALQRPAFSRAKAFAAIFRITKSKVRSGWESILVPLWHSPADTLRTTAYSVLTVEQFSTPGTLAQRLTLPFFCLALWNLLR